MTKVTIEKELLNDIYFALETARDNAIEVLNTHNNKCRRLPMTYDEKRIWGILTEDINDVEEVLISLSEKWKFGR